MEVIKMNTYKTSQIAAIAGIHPNTVRLYEEWGMISKPERQKNGYRIFTDLHVMKLGLLCVSNRNTTKWLKKENY